MNILIKMGSKPMSSRPILPIKGTITIGTMLNFKGKEHDDVTCKQS